MGRNGGRRQNRRLGRWQKSYDALLLPGGVMNPDRLRMDSKAVAFVKAFFDAKKPVAAICHGPWTLVEAGAATGRTMTSWPSLKTDIQNAGGSWVDQEVVVDGNLVTSRNPKDIPAFNREIAKLFADRTSRARRSVVDAASRPEKGPPSSHSRFLFCSPRRASTTVDAVRSNRRRWCCCWWSMSVAGDAVSPGTRVRWRSRLRRLLCPGKQTVPSRCAARCSSASSELGISRGIEAERVMIGNPPWAEPGTRRRDPRNAPVTTFAPLLARQSVRLRRLEVDAAQLHFHTRQRGTGQLAAR